ncbi:MAG: DUF1552 domain-containing protein [Myxococcota bacterium]|nr:DUF1552 domain-containing protein [Myxococcota bacterium]
MNRRWGRREFLRAAGITTAAGALAGMLPLTRAEAGGGPKRLVLVTSGQGTDFPRWRPTGGERDFVLSPQLEPLAAYRDRMLVLDGIDNVAARLPGSDGSRGQGGHFGIGTLWTGSKVPGSSDALAGKATAPSIDQIIADRVGTETRFDVLRFSMGATRGTGGGAKIAHWRAPGETGESEHDPARVFDRLFGDLTGGEEAAARLRAERRSVLDAVRGEVTRVRRELPEGDRDRMDAHLEGLRDLETRIARTLPLCAAPERPRELSPDQLGNWYGSTHHVLTALQLELLAKALVCDLTRVACFPWSTAEGSASFLSLCGYAGFNDMHGAAHDMDYDAADGRTPTPDEIDAARDNMNDLQRWRSEALATDLLGNLPPDVLDETLVVWASEMSEGGTHSNANIPLVMIQGAGFGYFETGRYLRWGEFDPHENFSRMTGRPMNEVLVSICHAMGLSDVDRVGDPIYSTGPLEGLR